MLPLQNAAVKYSASCGSYFEVLVVVFVPSQSVVVNCYIIQSPVRGVGTGVSTFSSLIAQTTGPGAQQLLV